VEGGLRRKIWEKTGIIRDWKRRSLVVQGKKKTKGGHLAREEGRNWGIDAAPGGYSPTSDK